ncbi:rootletin isoform X1 [Hypomesus transpacificus]|uniref:rootletin isoform X1 n=1 Tax=Hypomesus transpacificus TaxID=137520 RepID=UPI001F071244|nr:rootletin isoform X1 [Hypomesus transpacificus]
MRRFFRVGREEDYSQTHFLTAKCNRLTHEKAVLEREVLVSRERERNLQNDLEALGSRLYKQEQVNVELSIKHDQLVSRLRQEQVEGLVEFLRQRVCVLAEEGSREATVLSLQLEQVNSELLHLLSSEVQLEGLVDELHTEALQRAAAAEGLQAQLHSKTGELEELERSYAKLSVELEEQFSANRRRVTELQEAWEEQASAHQRRVEELQHENAASLRKLQDTAQQFEWLCEQQRHWICCVKRFKDGLSEEKENLVLQVSRLEKEVAQLRHGSPGPNPGQCCPLEDTCSRTSLWVAEEMDALQAQVDK